MIALIATILSCPSCNKQPTAMSKSEIEQDISDGIAQNFKYDKISDISFKQVETSSEEMEILKKNINPKSSMQHMNVRLHLKIWT